jgi:hypothetical protein
MPAFSLDDPAPPSFEGVADLLVKLVIVALLVGALLWLLRTRYTFVVRIEDGSPRLAQGRVTPAFLAEVGEVCSRAAVTRGWVGGIPMRKQVRLVFSRSIPEACRQQLRNAWMLHG